MRCRKRGGGKTESRRPIPVENNANFVRGKKTNFVSGKKCLKEFPLADNVYEGAD